MQNEMRDRLVEFIEQALIKWEDLRNDFLDEKIDDIPELKDVIADHLIENGVIVPPCSLNQVLWRITWNGRVEQCKVSSLTQKADGSLKIRISPKGSGVYEITVDEIGKTVFLTKEEAEQVLQKVGVEDA